MRKNQVITGLCILCAPLVSGCSDTDGLAASVNHSPITTQAVDVLLARRDISPAEATGDQRAKALGKLIDQELFVQEAYRDKLEEDPQVAQARKEILVRAYLQRQLNLLGETGPEAVASYYNSNPELFKERRSYQLQEVSIEAAGGILSAFEQKYPTLRTLNDLTKWLDEQGINYQAGASIKTSDELPMDLLPHLKQAVEGEVFKIPNPIGVNVMQVVRIEEDPVTLEEAEDDIRQYLFNRGVEKSLKQTTSNLRSKARIELYGDYAAAE